MNLGNDRALWLLFAVPVILVPAYIWCFRRKVQALRVLASTDMLKRINVSVSLKKQIFKAFLLISAFVLIVMALTRPRWNPQVQKILLLIFNLQKNTLQKMVNLEKVIIKLEQMDQIYIFQFLLEQ